MLKKQAASTNDRRQPVLTGQPVRTGQKEQTGQPVGLVVQRSFLVDRSVRKWADDEQAQPQRVHQPQRQSPLQAPYLSAHTIPSFHQRARAQARRG